MVARPTDSNLSLPSRRSFLGLTAAASAAVAMRIVTEPMLAYAAKKPGPMSQDEIHIDANENPLGPSASARAAAAAILPQGGRYSDWLTDDLVKLLAEMEGVKVGQVRVYPGSSEPLHHTVAGFTSKQRSYVTADPGYEAGMFAANTARRRGVSRKVRAPAGRSLSRSSSLCTRSRNSRDAASIIRAGISSQPISSRKSGITFDP